MHLPSSLSRHHSVSRCGEGRGRARSGGLLMEAVLAVALFAIFLGGIGLTLLLGERSTVAAGDRVRATFLAEQAIEGVRFLGYDDFDALEPGTYGVRIGDDGEWELVSEPVVTDDAFVSFVDILAHDEGHKEIVSRVEWDFGETRRGTIELATYVADWRYQLSIGNWHSLPGYVSVTVDVGNDPLLHDVLVVNDTAFLTGSSEEAGRGLYLFDVRNPHPVPLAQSFHLQASGYGMATDGTRLFVATDDPVAEIRVYDINDPASFGEDALLATYNLPGDGRARSVAFFGNSLFVGTHDDLENDHFYAFLVEPNGTLHLLDSLFVDGGVTGISLHSGYAYLSTTADFAEFQVVDVFNPDDLTFVPGRGIDLPDSHDALSITTFGQYVLLGRMQTEDHDEMILYSIDGAPVPAPPPGPWSFSLGGDARGIAHEPSGRYGFVVGNATNSQFRVLDIDTFVSGANPTVAHWNTEDTLHAVVHYWKLDRVYAVSSSHLFVFFPGL